MTPNVNGDLHLQHENCLNTEESLFIITFSTEPFFRGVPSKLSNLKEKLKVNPVSEQMSSYALKRNEKSTDNCPIMYQKG